MIRSQYVKGEHANEHQTNTVGEDDGGDIAAADNDVGGDRK